MGKPKRQYFPAQGPQQRRRLLREAGRAKPRTKFSISEREVRQATARMFNFVPLSQPSAAELSLLKRFTRRAVRSHSIYAMKTAQGLLSGKLYLIRQGKDVKPERGTARRMFSDAKSYKTDIKEVKPSGSTSIFRLGDGSRGLQGYMERGFDVLKWAREAYERKGSTIRFLDVGSATARMLGELKARMRDKVETHALTPVDEPRHKVDAYHMLTAEFLPREFRGKFDLIVSHYALEYAILPNLALRNITLALAPGGRAYLDWGAGHAYIVGEMTPEIKNFFASYNESKPSKGAKELIRWGMTDWGKRKVTADQAERAIREGIEKYGWDARQSIAWCNELARLKRNPTLKVDFLHTCPSAFGYIPSGILIERNV